MVLFSCTVNLRISKTTYQSSPTLKLFANLFCTPAVFCGVTLKIIQSSEIRHTFSWQPNKIMQVPVPRLIMTNTFMVVTILWSVESIEEKTDSH